MTNLLPADWVECLRHYHRIMIAFSGGLDSTVLLHALNSEPDLSPKLIAVHVNHQLQAQSDDWQAHCSQLCLQWHIPYIDRKVVVHSKSNIEASARRERYNVFRQLIDADDALVTAHHADDQIETFFLNLFRGSGVAGLASMPDRQPFANGMLLRPLLYISKQAIQAYARQHQLNWIDDPSNMDCRFRRNWLRHQWLPMLDQRWPKASDNILRTISLLQQSYQSEQSSASVLLSNCLETANRLVIEPLLSLNKIEQKSVLRHWLKQHHLNMPTKVQLEQLFRSVIDAKQDANPSWGLGDYVIRRYDGRLYLLPQSDLATSTKSVLWTDFPKPLCLVDKKQRLQLTLVGKLPDFKRVEIRFREGGERFHWRGKTRVVKKLLQDWKIPPWQRDHLPLLYIDNELVSIADLAISDRWQPVMLPLTIFYYSL